MPAKPATLSGWAAAQERDSSPAWPGAFLRSCPNCGVGRRLPLEDRLAEAQRIQVRILHHETQPHGPPRQLTYITTAFPRHHPFAFVADLFLRVSQCKTGNWFSGRVLEFDAQAAGRPGAEVHHEFTARERERPGHTTATDEWRVHRDEAVRAQRVADEMTARLRVVRLLVKRHLAR